MAPLSSSQEVAQLRAELDALRQTRTFRWTAPLRQLYARVRGCPAARNEDAHGLYAASPAVMPAIDECLFYHSMDLPHSGSITGLWDLRGNIDEHLGRTDFAGRRALEIGPASGYLGFEMERRGAEVVSVELAPDGRVDFLPGWWVDPEAFLSGNRQSGASIRNAYWRAHGELQSKARVHYGNAHQLPNELGRFDVGLISCVLLHSRDPIGIVTECARVVDQRMIIADLRFDHVTGPQLELWPSSENHVYDTWWRFSPDFFVQLLDALGFRRTQVVRYEQLFQAVDQMHPMFTVVADRE